MRAATDHERAARKAAAIASAETMLALAEVTGVDLGLLEHLRRRFERHLGMLDAIEEPARRAELERLMVEDGDELARAYRALRRAAERGGKA